MPGIRRHYTSTLAANAAILLLGVVSGVLAARLLGPGGRGELAALILWPTAIASLGNLGMNQAIPFFTAQRPQWRSAVFTLSLVIAALQSVVLVTLGYALLPYLLRRHEAHVLDWARWFLLYIPLTFVASYLLGILQGTMRLNVFNLSRIFVALWYTLVLVVLFVQRLPSVGAVATGQLVGYALMAALNLGLVYWLVRPALEWNPSLPGPLLNYGLKSHLGGATSYFNQRLDQLVMSVWLPPEALGFYVVAVALASPLTVIPNAIGIVTLPAAAREDPAGAKKVVRQSLRTVLVLLLGGAAVLFVLVPYLLPLFFGQAFRPAVTACRVLVVAMVPLGLSIVLYESLRALNHPFAQAYAEIAGIVVTLLLLPFLLPRYGFLGAALASLAAYATSLLVVLWYVHRKTTLRLSSFWSVAPAVDSPNGKDS